MKQFQLTIILCVLVMSSCTEKKALSIEVFETSSEGARLSHVKKFKTADASVRLSIDPSVRFQKITGFGGSFTESSAYLLNQLSSEKRRAILQAYFSEEGSNYSLTRTHMNSCDFSLNQYSYAPVEDDKSLESFSIEEDLDDLVPMIKEAQLISKEGFKIISSPWTAPPWMKDNKEWVGGKLLPKYYDTWALFFSKYLDAYKAVGIDIWGLTVENEPLGNGNNWESMHFTPKELTDFVVNHLGPRLEEDGKSTVKVLGYDQNREHLSEWVDEMFRDSSSTRYFDGTAIHWYASTYEVFADQLQYAHHWFSFSS